MILIGKGYYDRFIAKTRDGDTYNHLGNDADVVTTGGQVGGNTSAKPLLVGVCLEEQFLHELPDGIDFESGFGSKGIIPISDHDYIMDILLTPSRALILRNINP